jgi:hypothetical protein
VYGVTFVALLRCANTLAVQLVLVLQWRGLH